MKRTLFIFILLVFAAFGNSAYGQAPALTAAQEKQVNKAFETANSFMEERKYAEALRYYQEGLSIVPQEPSMLYNGGMAAFNIKSFETAAELWKRLKAVNPNDGQARSKLVQVYQALNKLPERDEERDELFDLWRSKKSKELSERDFYCREQFESSGYKLVVFEHFELKGPRALRYVFMISKPETEDFKISLGSYDLTSNIWRETTKPTPKEGERLFHLDGYFKNGHATYGMYHPAPTYEETRSIVIKILEGKSKPVSSSTRAQ